MAFFDSPKNRALWDKELAELRKEKEARARGSKHSAQEREADNNAVNSMNREAAMNMEETVVKATPYRERTSYKQLLAEEAASVRAARGERTRTVQKTKAHEMGAEPMTSNMGSGTGF